MRMVWFAICFSLGVTLMAVSGYLPQSASARGRVATREAEASETASDGPVRTLVPAVVAAAPSLSEPHTDDMRRSAVAPGRPSSVAVRPAQKIPAEDRSALPQVGPAKPLVDDTPLPAAIPHEVPRPVTPTGPPTPIGVDEVGEPSTPPAGAPAQPTAVAGPDRVVWIGWDELRLDGSESRGEGLLFQWRQVGGPTPLIIRDPHSPVTTAHGLLAEWKPSWSTVQYRFELTVIDANGEQDTDTVEFSAKPAPTLKLKPPGERRFELRDGYQFPLFALSQTNTESYEAVFEIAADSELTLTRVAGSPSTVVATRADKNHVYLVTVYPHNGAPSSWTEYLVNTAERVPAIVQLTVHWTRPEPPDAGAP